MDEGLLDIREHEGKGYKALIDYGGWRVAILRFEDGMQPQHQTSMERHLETDEVFVLTKGKGVLILGGNEKQLHGFAVQPMDIGKLYNIRRKVWHTVSLSRDASVVIVENQDTGQHNSEYDELTAEQQQLIRDMTRGEQFG
jgi:mannose-6-phosphate isomerase-like protein (cupin superfamily)